MKLYALYLRKSRADQEAEARGEGETLAKHRAALTAYARQRGLTIAREYAELVSGDTIAARPQMQALLTDVKAGMYAGVIVNDVDRLGRGDSIDQEIIKLTFASSHTLIITPSRDIDPANPSDDDMLDFSMFMARMEYKKISARMKQGRARSAAAGSWVSGHAPYGYRCVREGKRVTLEPDPDTAPIVQQIFAWYASGEKGYQAIATTLTEMDLPINGRYVYSRTVSAILHNPAYIGRTEYGRHVQVSTIEDGRRVKKTVRADPYVVIPDTHPAIIDMDTWQAVQDRAAKSRHRSPVNTNEHLRNPLAGFVYCAECGAMMSRQYSARIMLRCPRPGCPTCGSYLDAVEDALLDVLSSWCAEYADAPSAPRRPSPLHEAVARQLAQVDAQITRAQELVEQGVYSVAEYMARREALDARRIALNAELDKLYVQPPEEAIPAILPQIRRVLDAYPRAETAEQKNALLRSVVQKVVYHKTERGWINHKADMALDVYPVISDSI